MFLINIFFYTLSNFVYTYEVENGEMKEKMNSIFVSAPEFQPVLPLLLSHNMCLAWILKCVFLAM